MSQVLEVKGIRKYFPGVKAVDNISLTLEKGQVIALLGENGAGKSTLTKMISGSLKPDAGEIIVDGASMHFESAYQAMHTGIAMVYQELTMIGSMSVAENVFMNRQPVKKMGNIDWKVLNENTRKLLEKFNLSINPGTLVKDLSIGTQQLLEILKALSFEAKVIILDEPTSSLTEADTQLLFEIIEKLKKEGYSFIYITHKLSEVFQIADKVVVMRDGMHIGTEKIEDLNERQIINMMVGREIKDLYGSGSRERFLSKDFFFRVENLTANDLYQNVSFGVRKGEIVGFAGLIGAGRTEMALGIMGAHKRDGGEIYIDSREIPVKNPKDAIKAKIAYLTEDRKKLGLTLDFSIKLNLVSTHLEDYTEKGMINSGRIDRNAVSEVEKYKIATPSIDQKVGNLSGGNQQKCLISSWMGIDPELIIFDEPTRGVDVGAKAEIYEKIKNFSDEGKGVVIISSELPELLGTCDRIYVMHEGKIQGELEKQDFSEDLIMEYATGVKSK